MNYNDIKMFLDLHSIKYTEENGKMGRFFVCYVYNDDSFDIISEKVIVSGNKIINLNIKSLMNWLGY